MTPEPRASGLVAEAETYRIEDLVALVKRGSVRVPTFQRGLRWDSTDVIALFDSVYNGYPIGSLLLRKGPAPAEQLSIGPLQIDAPETQSARWVIDGQQRLSALAGALARPTPQPTTPQDSYVLFFDASDQKFKAPARDGRIPEDWVPVAQLLDSTALTEWVFNWKRGKEPKLRRIVFEAGSRIREYRVPLYVVETGDEYLLRDIFYRINNYGRSLKWEEVHDALFGRTGTHPSTISELASEVSSLGMGIPDEGLLLTCVLAFRGLDVTRSIADHYRRDRAVLKEGVRDALPSVRAALSFLKRSAEIPHLRLLPRSTPLPVLTRFFGLHPEPNTRTTELLVRWTWRTLVASGVSDERTLLRHGVGKLVASDEEKSVQHLLTLIPRKSPAEYSLPTRFDARAADSRFALLGLVSLKPLALDRSHEVKIADLIEDEDVDAFRKILPLATGIGRSPANRILLPGHGAAHSDLLRIDLNSDYTALLRTHAVSVSGLRNLKNDEPERFLEDRASLLQSTVRGLINRLAAWSKSDRPSIAYLIGKKDR